MRGYGYRVRPPKDVLLWVTCDRCKRNMVSDVNSEGEVMTIQGTSFSVGFGYGSRHDGQVWDFDLCDDCADKMKTLFDLRGVPDTNAGVKL